MYRADTIIAPATPSGRGAVAIVRVSGREAFRIAQQLLRLENCARPVPWKLHRCTAVDALSGEPIDDVLAVWMPRPRTYTGEDIVEIHCHGSPVVVECLIAAGTRVGARPAERGEFTRRAVLNGRMDLAQAEAVADLVDSRVRGGARLAWAQLQGALSQRLLELREALLHVLADVEANVDFSDDDLPEERVAPRFHALRVVEAEISAMLTGFVAARRWREGYRVVFTGPPNVGKSSLVNALLGYGRMIVSDEPGTTRDVVEEAIDLDGCAFVLTDTAGLRESSSLAESLAVVRTREKLAEADIVVCVFDSSAPAPAPEERAWMEPGNVGCIVVGNKSDLPRRLDLTELRRSLGSEPYALLETSAVTGAGCDTFADTLVELARHWGPDMEQATAGISRVRHRSALEHARVALLAAIELLQKDGGSELVSIELRGALAGLAAITDPVDNEDVLDHIFRDFCIGK